jgi:5-methylcytosine-specific restriction enzyme A
MPEAMLRPRGRELQRLRQRLLRRRPLCVACERRGVITPAAVLDHIVALVNGGDNSDANLQGLCHSCHEQKTRRDLGQSVKGCDAHGFPIDDEHHWHRS